MTYPGVRGRQELNPEVGPSVHHLALPRGLPDAMPGPIWPPTLFPRTPGALCPPPRSLPGRLPSCLPQLLKQRPLAASCLIAGTMLRTEPTGGKFISLAAKKKRSFSSPPPLLLSPCPPAPPQAGKSFVFSVKKP